ncbi:MAG: periplasmic heavy metal sensor [candidate division WOR-3 bacterium]
MKSLIPLIILISQPEQGEFLKRMFLKRNPEIIIRVLALDSYVQKNIGLSKEEAELFKNLYFNLEKETEKIKSEIRIKEIELEEVMQSEKIDFNKAEKLIEELAELNKNLRIKQIEAFKKVYDKLGNKRFNEIREKLREMRRERDRERKMLWKN